MEALTQAFHGIPNVDLTKPPVFYDYLEDGEVIQGEHVDMLRCSSTMTGITSPSPDVPTPFLHNWNSYVGDIFFRKKYIFFQFCYSALKFHVV